MRPKSQRRKNRKKNLKILVITEKREGTEKVKGVDKMVGYAVVKGGGGARLKAEESVIWIIFAPLTS